MRSEFVRITSKGQVTIPAAIRERAGLLPDTEVEFLFDGETVQLRRVYPARKPSRGERLVAHLRAHRGGLKMTTDEIMALTRGED
jgi:AbrB family looped-hinge helix DNA binding protein